MTALKRAVAVFQVEVEMPANYDADWKIGQAQAQIGREAREKLADILAKSNLTCRGLHLHGVILTTEAEDGKAVRP